MSEATPTSTVHQADGEPKKRKIGFVVAPLFVFLALVVMFGLSLTSGDPSKLPSALIGKPVPATDFKALPGLDGAEAEDVGVAAATLKNGRVSVVNFWASWCNPCIEEHPHLVALKGMADIDLYGVNYKDQPSAARRFLGRYGNPFTSVGVDPRGRNAIEWGVYGMPETFVIDGQGRIVYKHVGPITYESLQTRVLPAIERAQAAPSTTAPQG